MSSLKATFRNMYRITDRKKATFGHLMFTYLVTGKAADIQRYKEIVAERLNRPIEAIPNDNGQPLFFVNTTLQLEQNGTIAKQQLDLEFNRERTNTFVDNTTQEIQSNEELSVMVKKEKATLIARRQLGMDKPMPTTVPSTNKPVEIPAEVKADELIDNINAKEPVEKLETLEQ